MAAQLIILYHALVEAFVHVSMHATVNLTRTKCMRVSACHALNACLQVSGVRFAFDPSRPPGSRIPPEGVTTGSSHTPLDLTKTYTLATKEYLAQGKDGYDVLEVSHHDTWGGGV
jgi:hypothetical protein